MEKIVSKLDRIFSIQDIMTPAAVLVRASSLKEASTFFTEYDVVPYPKTGKITGFFRRDLDKLCDLKPDWLISDTTSLLKMPILLSQESFRFIISADQVAGYVHYSDLNKPAMKVPLFVLIQAMERKLWDRIEDKITEDVVREVFPDDAHKFIKKQAQAIKSNVDIGWMGIFTLPGILRLVNYFKLANLSAEQIESLRLIRNDVAHSDRNLIGKHRDASKLVETLRLCQLVLKNKAG